MSRAGGRAVVEGAEAYAPEILVSSRDGHPVPIIPGVVRLDAAAVAAGWTSTVTYARCRRGATYLVTRPGELKRQAHELESVCVRLGRPDGSRGWAFWERESDRGRWGFSLAMIMVDGEWVPHLGLRELMEVISRES